MEAGSQRGGCSHVVTLLSAPGVQEFVEAASFLHYIRHRSLVSLEEINAGLVFVRPEEPPPTVRAPLPHLRRVQPRVAPLGSSQMLLSFP